MLHILTPKHVFRCRINFAARLLRYVTAIRALEFFPIGLGYAEIRYLDEANPWLRLPSLPSRHDNPPRNQDGRRSGRTFSVLAGSQCIAHVSIRERRFSKASERR